MIFPADTIAGRPGLASLAALSVLPRRVYVSTVRGLRASGVASTLHLV